jgi:hypothetical protein
MRRAGLYRGATFPDLTPGQRIAALALFLLFAPLVLAAYGLAGLVNDVFDGLLAGESDQQ